MTTYWLRFDLESDATFGKGDGIPGLVDQEVVLDQLGCPYLHGRTLKGLLNEVCADLLFVLKDDDSTWRQAADQLFGRPGSKLAQQGIMSVGHAKLPASLRTAVQHAIIVGKWTREDVLNSLTTIRRQTAIEAGGAPDPHTLRSGRVILRQTPFESKLTFVRDPKDTEKALFAACVKGLRRAGTARNRGRGRLVARIESEGGQDVTSTWFQHFKQEVCP